MSKRWLLFCAAALLVCGGLILWSHLHGKAGGGKSLFLCPMHPTYIVSSMGDCPICGMRLVAADANKNAAQDSANALYQCPLHPIYTADKAGECAICGVELESKGVPGMVALDLSEREKQLAGVQTADARVETIRRKVRTVGTVIADETRVRHVHTKVAGWVEKLHVNFTGQMVKQGDPLLTLYSPDLLVAERQYLQALSLAKQPGSDDMLQAARERLELLDVSADFLQELERTRVAHRAITFLSPVSGFVTNKQVFEGQQVEPGFELFTITDMAQVWIEADFYEFEADLLRLDQEATFVSPYHPALQLRGRVAYIYPYLSPVSRTVKVRFRFTNDDLRLKLGMYMDVTIDMETAQGVVVPDSAILDSGVRKVVFVDNGKRFEPRQVTTGLRGNGLAQILSGLDGGERVVVKGNFLLDSESRLRAALLEMK